ncbi:sulfotransferase family protein [Nioella sp. MMSF_3534]|uniref:sulfotransferase family protein n=1 Tax=Nioella sp. MMSF_3534 TaxID=3046720 RepID=UPI00273F7477|nr:sulfotransferase family protein [Nioella sp. MMSF_3534]
MALQIIGAGFGRTGTESLKRALEILGFGPCHHMHEVMARPGLNQQWRAIAAGAEPDWATVFSGYQSTVDWPSTHYWDVLADHYPEAKIILSVRDADSWFNSMQNTILPVLRDSTDRESFGCVVIRDKVFSGRLDDRDHIIGVYEDHVAQVKARIPPERLLTYELGSGWEPLCTFLGCDVPSEPYPSGNRPEQFHEKIAEADAAKAVQ